MARANQGFDAGPFHDDPHCSTASYRGGMSSAFAAGQSGMSQQVRVTLVVVDGAKRLASFSVLTMSGKASPFGDGGVTSYVKSATKTGEEKFYTTGEIEEGISGNLTPTVTRMGQSV